MSPQMNGSYHDMDDDFEMEVVPQITGKVGGE
jgi:hypothetical protein